MRNKRKYVIYTLDARALLNLRGEKKGRVDFNTEYDREKILLEENRFAESALIYQIIRAGRITGDDRPVREMVTKSLVYLDFRRDISDIEGPVRELLSDGFEIRFRGDNEYTRFLPFDKSASMSRECTMSFISEAVLAETDEALDMGLDIRSMELFPSKYYAYRGLYMTDGTAVDSDRFKLNEKTVVVLKTKKELLDNRLAITVPADVNSEGKVEVNSNKLHSIDEYEFTPFDGEGLISPEYTEIINQELSHRRGAAATSFQIRMPFGKGMLHSVNFKKFIRDQFPDEDPETLEITDFFGIKRRLAEVEIILTDSMFKCARWIEGIADDPMECYFRNFVKYEHALYVANTDTGIRSTRQIKMNYQFLNTLDLDRETFEKLVQNHIKDTEAILKDPARAREVLLNADIDDAVDIDSERMKHMRSWEYALMINTGFADDPLIRNRLRQAAKGQIKDVLRGRINVRGCVKYLSSDLLQLLIDIAENCGVKDKEKKDVLEKNTLMPDRFYVTGINSEGLSWNEYYGVLRSPHLSRNEQCALRPYTSEIYKKYFGKLKGVIMVSRFSDAPAAMSGADFDGDMVKIVMDKDINDAILRSVYEVDHESGPDAHGVMRYRRIMPVPVINSPKGSKRYLGSHISYPDLRASFAGRVGHISNIAISIAKLEYDKSVPGVVPANSAALCTIATGLEIDSVKTGAGPDISYLEGLCSQFTDVYLKIHNSIKNVYRDSKNADRAVHVSYSEADDEYTAYFRFKRSKKNTQDLFTIKGDQWYNIDRLPYHYARAIDEKRAGGRIGKSKDAAVPRYRFVFEIMDNWREEALKDPRISELMGIIGAYRKLKADSWNIGRAEKQASEDSLRGKIVTLLDTEYDIGTDRLYRSDEFIDEALECAYQEMYEIVKDQNTADEALQLMDDLNWQYCQTFEAKTETLNEILGTADLSMAALEILCDTYDNGYQILNYVLRDVLNLRRLGELQNLREEDDVDEESGSSIMSPWRREYSKDLFRQLFAGYKAYYTRQDYSKTDWMDDAGEICRAEALKLFDGDIDSAIECSVALDKSMDEKHSFLWNVFDAEDFGGVIYDDIKKGLI